MKMTKNEYSNIFKKALNQILSDFEYKLPIEGFELHYRDISYINNIDDLIDCIYISENEFHVVVDIGLRRDRIIFIRPSGHKPIPYSQLNLNINELSKKYKIPINLLIPL